MKSNNALKQQYVLNDSFTRIVTGSAQGRDSSIGGRRRDLIRQERYPLDMYLSNSV